MPSSLTLPTEITLQIARCMFLQSNPSAYTSDSRHKVCSYKPPWRDIAGLTVLNCSMRRFALRLWFSTFVLQETSDLKVGLDMFPDLASCINQLVVSISRSWAESELLLFPRLDRLERLIFTEHNDASPAEGNLFLIEALQRIPRSRLTHVSCSFADAAYLRSTWPYLGEFPLLQELRLQVCSPASCVRRPRLTRLALAEVRMPLLEDEDIGIIIQALAGLPNLRTLHTGVFTISQGSLLMHWGLHEPWQRNQPQYDPWASDCTQCRTDAMPEALRRAELASESLAKVAPMLRRVEWASWFAPMKEGTLAFDLTRNESGELINVNSILYLV